MVDTGDGAGRPGVVRGVGAKVVGGDGGPRHVGRRIQRGQSGANGIYPGGGDAIAPNG
jgi:hypothetical protein